MRLFFAAIVGVFLFSACQNPAPKKRVGQTQVEEFAQQIESDFSNGRTVGLDLHFDRAVFVNRVVNDPYWDEQLDLLKNRTYKKEYKEQLLKDVSLAGLFLSGLDKRSYFAYDLVKTYEINGRWHAIFRIYANEALNYHDYLLRVNSAKVWIEDMYITSVGRQLSEILREMYVAGIPSAKGDVRWRDHQLLIKTKQLMQQEQYEMAIATIDSVSPDFASKKSIQLFRLQLFANVPNENYIREIEAYEAKYPDDAGTLLLQLDKNLMSGNYPTMLEELNQLEKMFGPDPVVDFMRGNALNLLGKCQDAGTMYKSALAAKPNWQNPLNNWIDCLLKDRQYSAAILLFKKYKTTFEISPSYVKYYFRAFADFLNSKEFKAWEAEEANLS